MTSIIKWTTRVKIVEVAKWLSPDGRVKDQDGLIFERSKHELILFESLEMKHNENQDVDKSKVVRE